MSWNNKMAVGAVMVLGYAHIPTVSATPIRHARAIGYCPAYHDRSALAGGQVLDGAPSENATLQGETLPSRHREQRGLWRVAYIYTKGSIVNLECNYASGDKMDVPVQDMVDICLYRRRGSTFRLGCYRSPRK